MAGRQVKVTPQQEQSQRINGIETVFNAPFDVVNAAVFRQVTLWATEAPLDHSQHTTAGAVRYYMGYPDGTKFILFVLKRDDNITSIEANQFVNGEWCGSTDPSIIIHMTSLVTRCYEDVYQAMRYKHPDFTLDIIGGVTPPMPKYNREGWIAVFAWHLQFARNWSEEKLADEQGVSVRTLYNERTTYKMGRTKLNKDVAEAVERIFGKKPRKTSKNR